MIVTKNIYMDNFYCFTKYQIAFQGSDTAPMIKKSLVVILHYIYLRLLIRNIFFKYNRCWIRFNDIVLKSSANFCWYEVVDLFFVFLWSRQQLILYLSFSLFKNMQWISVHKVEMRNIFVITLIHHVSIHPGKSTHIFLQQRNNNSSHPIQH